MNRGAAFVLWVNFLNKQIRVQRTADFPGAKVERLFLGPSFQGVGYC